MFKKGTDLNILTNRIYSSLKEQGYTDEEITESEVKLSDVIKAVADLNQDAEMADVKLNSAVAVVDVSKCKMYIKNFGEFFVNQIEHAGTIILSRTGNIADEKLNKATADEKELSEKIAELNEVKLKKQSEVQSAEIEFVDFKNVYDEKIVELNAKIARLLELENDEAEVKKAEVEKQETVEKIKEKQTEQQTF